MITAQQLDQLEPQQMRAAVLALMQQINAQDERIARQSREMVHKQALIDKLTHENATLKRLKLAAKSEAYSAEQRSLLEEALDTDLAELGQELANLGMPLPEDEEDQKHKARAKRQLLPANLPRTDIRHEPHSTVCGCGCQMKRIGEDVVERLDYQPGTFSVERHIRGKWAWGKCQKLVQEPAEPHIIDKGIPTTALLAQVLVAKYLDQDQRARTACVPEECDGAPSDATGKADRRTVAASLATFRNYLSGQPSSRRDHRALAPHR